LGTEDHCYSAYESEVPEAIIPESVARQLGLYPKLPPGTEVGDFKTVGGVAKATGLEIWLKPRIKQSDLRKSW